MEKKYFAIKTMTRECGHNIVICRITIEMFVVMSFKCECAARDEFICSLAPVSRNSDSQSFYFERSLLFFQNENRDKEWSVWCVLDSLQTWRTRAIYTIVRAVRFPEENRPRFFFVYSKASDATECECERVKWGKIQLDFYRFFFTMFLLLLMLRTNKRNGTRLSMF